MSFEPIIRCNDGTTQQDLQLERLSIHDFTRSTGIQTIVVPEFSIFLLGSAVTSTEVWCGMRQRQRCYEPGDLAYLPAGTDIRTHYASGVYSETLIRIPVEVVHAAANAAQLPYETLMDYRVVPERYTLGLAQALRRMALANALDTVLPMLAEGASMALATNMVRTLIRRPDAQDPAVGLTTQRRRRVVDYIEANLSRPISLADIAGVAALSPYHFARAFKDSMGVTPVRYVWQRRLDLARRLLRETGAPLVDVALACGYASQSHFTTAFKTATGVTPAAYRRGQSDP